MLSKPLSRNSPFLFLLISLSREWSSRIGSAMVCDSTVLRWQPTVFWLPGCFFKICSHLFFCGSAGWCRRKRGRDRAGAQLPGHSRAGRPTWAERLASPDALSVTQALVKLCPEISQKVFWNETQKPWSFTKSLATWQANVVSQAVGTATVTPATHKPHSTAGRMCWLSTLFCKVLQRLQVSLKLVWCCLHGVAPFCQ